MQLLWLYGELGEVGDVIKKDGNEKIMTDKAVRKHFVEETMYCFVMILSRRNWKRFILKSIRKIWAVGKSRIYIRDGSALIRKNFHTAARGKS